MSTRGRIFRLVLVALGGFLVGYGVAVVRQDPKRQLAAVVNDESISVDELRRELTNRFAADVLRDLVHQRLILQEARKKKLEPDPKEIEKRLQEMKSQPEVQAMLKAGQVAENDLRRNLSVLVPLEALVQSSLSIDDEHSYLQQHRGELESLEVAHILLPDVAQAQKVRALASQPKADFGALAKQYSQDPRTKDSGGKLGELRRSELEPDVAEALFQLQKGEVSPPMQGEDGVHLFLVLSRKTSLEDLRPEIRQILTAAQRGDYLEELRSNAKIQTFPPYRLPASRSQELPSTH